MHILKCTVEQNEEPKVCLVKPFGSIEFWKLYAFSHMSVPQNNLNIFVIIDYDCYLSGISCLTFIQRTIPPGRSPVKHISLYFANEKLHWSS